MQILVMMTPVCNLPVMKPENKKRIEIYLINRRKMRFDDDVANPHWKIYYILISYKLGPIKKYSAEVCSAIVTWRNTQEGRKCLVKLLLNYSKTRVTGFVLPSFTE